MARDRHAPVGRRGRILRSLETLAGRENNGELLEYSQRLKEALIETVAQGTITGDLRGKTTDPASENVVDMYGFLDAVERNIV